ncbi:MAG: glycosyltransferase [Planctomycetes bacterium]|nr:glycosyltransferase [Planctomycetota bacterium]
MDSAPKTLGGATLALETPEVSYVTPVYANEATLGETLRCIAAQVTDRSWEAIVVDDGSPDGSVAIVEDFARRDPRVRLIKKANGGEASALNVGFRAARGRFIAIVEGDVEPAPDWLERCLATLDKDEDVWAVGGYLETPPEDSWIARLAGYEIERKFKTKPRETKHLTSANVVYRREAFEIAGPFDERLINASLDSVFNARLAKVGRRLVYEASARVRHHYKTTGLGYLKRQWAYARYRVHNEDLDLYPADRFLAAHVALAALASACTLTMTPIGIFVPGPGGWVLKGAGPSLFGLALLLQTPQAIRILIERRDPAALLYPPVIVARNVVGAWGYAVGVVQKALGRI